MNELEKKIQEQFGAELMIHDSFNPFSSLFVARMGLNTYQSMIEMLKRQMILRRST